MELGMDGDKDPDISDVEAVIGVNRSLSAVIDSIFRRILLAGLIVLLLKMFFRMF